jgi:hypothetical protein
LSLTFSLSGRRSMRDIEICMSFYNMKIERGISAERPVRNAVVPAPQKVSPGLRVMFTISA